MMRVVVLTLAGVAAAGAIAAAAVIALGLYNVSARTGHWPITTWLLQAAYVNAIELRAPPASAVPPLTDERVALGARHYDTACRMCHAAPGSVRTATIRAMEPEPPHIVEAIEGWQPRHLGWIVREGVKMTGMPGWPAGREDEMWSVVAFLTRVGTMDEAGYRALTAIRSEPGEPTGLGYCAGCHGRDGRSGNPHIPRLDILSEAYMAATLQAYRDGVRESAIMAQAVSRVPGDALGGLVRHFAAARPEGGAGRGDPALVARGRELAFAETADADVPACRSCHGPWPERLNPEFPALAGQYETYLATQLRLWKQTARGGSAQAELMRKAVLHLTDDDIAALSAYYASLPPSKLPQGGGTSPQ